MSKAVLDVVVGRSVPGRAGQTTDLVNPATGQVFGTAPLSGQEDVDAALRNPQRVALEAQAMGMVIPAAPVFLDLRTGRTSGVRTPSTPDNAIQLLPPAPPKPAVLAPPPTVVEVPADTTTEVPADTQAKADKNGKARKNRNR